MTIGKKIAWLTIFSVAMGFMETAVVVYLRKIYYPGGFQFPLIPIDADIALVEFLREAATILMLVGIGILTGKTASQKFAFFIYSFAVWDIFYYIFLKLLIDWPESLLTWDILFLIPVPWVGPVIVPCIVSITMIVFNLLIVYFVEKGWNARVRPREWILLIAGSVIVILSFVTDYFRHVGKNPSGHYWTLGSNEALFSEIHTYVPSDYNWWIFLFGEAIIVLGIIFYVKRVYQAKRILI